MRNKKPTKNKSRRVVITGIGVIAPNGIGKDTFWQANVSGVSGISPITTFETSELATKIAGSIPDFDPAAYIEESNLRKFDRFAQFGVAATQMALEDAQFTISDSHSERIGVCVGSGLGGMLFHEEQILKALNTSLKKTSPLAIVKIMPNAVTAQISINFKIKGPSLTISTGCSSGLQALGEAYHLIQNNTVDHMVTGGVEAPLTPITFSAFNSMKVMSQRNDAPQEASRPFDKDRDGFVLAEGAGIVILESLEAAQARKAPIYAEVIGFANNSSAYHIVMPQPDGKDIEQVMRMALDDAEVKPTQIDYINAHGTSTPSNDRAETLGIKGLFGKYANKLLVSATKSMVGHTIGAAGALGTIISALTIQNGIIAPTINQTTPDPECDLNFVANNALSKEVQVSLVNAFGFGGSNASLVLRKYEM
ncbi:beta-ketoacyl-ACP synthase II [Candidatus Omnitrophota bacterium]